MDIVAVSALFLMAFICLAVLVYLKQKADREMIQDILGVRADIGRAKVALQISMDSNNSVINKFLKEVDVLNAGIGKIANSAESADLATQTILREYELNGVPLGYQRKEEDAHIDAFEGV